MDWITLLVIILIIVIFVVIVVYLVYRIWLRKLEDAYLISQQQYCQNTPDPSYREEVFIPSDPLVYDQTLAIALVDICFATTLYNCRVYGREIDIETDHPPGLPEVTIFNGVDPGDGQTTMIAIGYYNPETKMGVIAFGGTFTLGEWKDNLTYVQVTPTKLQGSTPNMLVHSGFYGLYTSVQDQIRQWITQRTFTGLFITGHSLGGALTEICSYDITNYLPTVQVTVGPLTVYSFAAPRPGNVPFTDGINAAVPQLQRIANIEDAVTGLPPPVFDGLIYNHPNTLVPFNVNLGTVQANHIDAYKNYLPLVGCYTSG